jgi:phospholipid/cholesterol/gamma-HCH transport system ATP-binding protein
VTFVIVTHELESIFATGNDGVFLDAETRTMIARGAPGEMAAGDNPRVRAFLARRATVEEVAQ